MMEPGKPNFELRTSNFELRLLFWESTARCNLACRHCRRIDPSAGNDLTTDEFRRVLDSVAALGKPIIVFSGGEPLLRDDWESLAAHAAALNLPAALATNGTMVDDALARRIAAAGFRRVSVSLDGADAATHEGLRGVSGCFEQAMAGLAALRRAGVSTQINSTIAAHNAHQLDELYALAGAVGAVALHLFLLVPVGCGAEIGASHQLAPQRYEEVLRWVCGKQGRTTSKAASLPPHSRVPALELKATCAPHYHRVAAQTGLSVRGRGCLCGSSVAFVSHDGKVFPCGYLPVECGDVRREAFARIWRESEVFANLRDPARIKGKCGRCDYAAACGGCRARAYALTGDYLAAEPSCTYAPPKG